MTTPTVVPPRPGVVRSGRSLLAALVVAVAATAGAMLTVASPLVVGALGLLLMLLLLALRVPIALALLVPALLGLYAIRGMTLVGSLLSRKLTDTVASWELSVLPMFILMGFLISATGISATLYRAAQQWLWWLPGNLAIATNVAGAGLSAVSGSTVGTTFALGRVGGPEMIRAGYHKRFAIVAIMSSGLSGNLIPPSITLVIYSGIAATPVGLQLVAGTLPGVLVAVTFALVFLVVALVAGDQVGGRPDRALAAPPREMLRTTLRAWPVPVLIVIVLGGMLSGLFTATEAAAAAAAVALLMAVPTCLRARTARPLLEAFTGTFRTVGMIFLLLIGAVFLTEMFALTGLSRVVEATVAGAGLDRITFLLVMAVVYLVLGTALDTLSMMLLTVPVLLPTLETLGISPIFFGVFVVLLAEIGALTPPVGVLLYVVERLFKDPQVNLGQTVTVRDVFVSVLWVLPGALLALVILIFFPQIATFLPDSLGE